MKWLRKVKSLATIWLIFTLIFAALCIFHLRESTKSIEEFKAEEIEYAQVDVEFLTSITGVDLNKPLRKFVKDFNEYIESYNNSSSSQNKLTAFGYLVAAATAMVSMCLEIKANRNHLK